MVKVECEACKAPYQVDEKRIPPTGLKMRCPKCGHAFTVQNPNAGALPIATAASGPNVPSRRTMVGVGVGQPGGPSLPIPLAAPVPAMDDMGLGDDPFPALPAVRSPAKPPPPRPYAVARPAQPAPAVATAAPPLGEIDELLDLPAMPDPVGLPAVVRPLPPVKPTLASRVSPPKPEFEIDLPSPVADLPSARVAKSKDAPAPVVGGSLTFEMDLPASPAELPSAKGPPKPKKPPPPAPGGGHADLPALVEAGLPAAFGEIGLPAPVAIGLPAKRAFGEIDLPVVGGSLPSVVATGLPVAVGASALPAVVDQQRYLPQSASPEFNLPTAMGADMHLPQAADALPSSFGEASYLPANQESLPDTYSPFEVEGAGAAVSSPQPTAGGQGGVGYGELDFGSDLGGGGDVATDEVGAPPESNRPPGVEAAFPTEDAPAKGRDRVVIKKNQSRAPKVVLAVAAAAVIGGALLGLTRYGMFGTHAMSDSWHKTEWRRAADNAMAKTRQIIGADLYDKGRGAADAMANQSAALPRARALAAAAALTEYEFQLRYGRDPARSTRAQAWLASIESAANPPGTVQYYTAAAAGKAALADDLPGARSLLNAAAQKDTGDPVQQDVALVLGEVELKAKDPKAATAAFSRALVLSPSARAHFGLARSSMLAGDPTKTRAELAATLAATPNHPGALVLRAEVDWDTDRNEPAVLEGLKPLLDGPAKESASSGELSRAYTLRGWVEAARGNVNDARLAFEAALKLDNRNVQALIGQGEVFYTEGRYTEALSRFDTAAQSDPTNVVAIVADAKAKIALERLADAKTQLTLAQKQIPKSMEITFWLGRASEVLGDKKGAEAAYTTAIALANPKDRDAVDPYVALSKLLAGEGRESEAQAKLDEARTKLPDSAAMQRALGEVAAVRGLYDEAISHYESAIAKDPKDLGARFLLGVTYRRMQRLTDASAQLELVAASDKEYPNLAMERGLVFEQSGRVEEALQQFQTALAKAPQDLDLKLRVGAAYVGIGKPDEAIKMLREVFAQRQNSAEVNHYLGRAYFLQGSGPSMVEAAKYLRRAVELDPNRAEYHLYLAWVATESPQIDLGTAREEVKKALQLDQLLADAYWQRGVTEEIGGAVDDAIVDLQKALTLRPTRTEAHATLARCYTDKNQPEKAVAEWAIAVTQNDERPDWQYGYGKLLFERNNTAAALPHLLAAATVGEKATPAPFWLAQSEFMLAEALRKGGKKPEAKEHYHWFLRTAQPSSPDRTDALRALKSLGEVYDPSNP